MDSADVDPDPDLDRIAAELADVEQALARLDDGTYWTDEVTGEPLADDVLAESPTARRAVYVPFGPPVTPPGGIPRVPPPEPSDDPDPGTPPETEPDVDDEPDSDAESGDVDADDT
ncbi:hypothetical protein BH24ACT5_BH24ACT5_04480 [soil metagenome]